MNSQEFLPNIFWLNSLDFPFGIVGDSHLLDFSILPMNTICPIWEV